jgi:hypothetical protein
VTAGDGGGVKKVLYCTWPDVKDYVTGAGGFGSIAVVDPAL